MSAAAGVAINVRAQLLASSMQTVVDGFAQAANVIAKTFTNILTGAFTRIFDTLRTMVLGGALAIAASLTASVVVAGSLEQKFLDIRKVLDISAGGFEKIKNELRQTAATLAGMPIEKLLKAAEVGASAGIAPKDLTEFAKNVSIGSVALGIDSEQVATKMVEMSKIFETPTGEIRNFISAINELENKTTATAAQIFNITNRMAGAAAQAKLFTYEAAALATAMNQGGVSAEIAGTALTKFFQRMQQDDVLKNAANLVGMQADAFKELFRQTPIDAITRLGDAFRKLGQGEQEAFMNALGFKDARYSQAMAKLLQRPDDIRKNLDIAKRGFITGSSAEQEYGIRSDSLFGQFDLMRNRVELLAEAIGNRLMPGVKDFVKSIGQLATILKENEAAWGGWLDKISNGFKTVASLIRNPMQGLAILKSYLEEIWDNVPAMASAAMDAILRGALGLIQAIAKALGYMFENVMEQLSLLLGKKMEEIWPSGGGQHEKQMQMFDRRIREQQEEMAPGIMRNFMKGFSDAFAGFQMPQWAGRGAERAPLWQQIKGNEAFRMLQDEAEMIYNGARMIGLALMKGADVANKEAERKKKAEEDAAGVHEITDKEAAALDKEFKFADALEKRVQQLMGGGRKEKPFQSEILDADALWKKIQTGGSNEMLDIDMAILKANEEMKADQKLGNDIQMKIHKAIEDGAIVVDK